MLNKKLMKAFVAEMRDNRWRVLSVMAHADNWVVTYEQDYQYSDGSDVLTDIRCAGFAMVDGSVKPRFDMVLSVRSQKHGKIR